jgi:crossover junction endodeoxyribonuclease RusA
MRVFLPYPPSANERLTVRKGGKGFVNTARYRAWAREAVWIVAMAARGGKGVAGPFRLFALARQPDLRRSRDLDNLLKATCDALKAGGAIEDDSLCQEIRIVWSDLDEPGILVEIEACESLLSPVAGKSKSPNETRKSPIRRQSRRAVTTPAADAGESLDTAKGDVVASDSPPSSIPAEDTACPKARDKPKT